MTKAVSVAALRPVERRQAPLAALRVEDGTLEGLKWLALLLMTLDHANKYLLADRVPAMFAAGRLAMPLFAFALSYNLARPGVLTGGGAWRILRRLLATGAIATLPFIGLGGLGWGWWPLNILATLTVSTAAIALLQRGGVARKALAVALVVVGGAFVEFWWPAVVMCIAAWYYCKRPTLTALTLWVGATASLYLINRNWWALAAFAVIFAAPHVHLRMPRLRWAFYAYYPLHLLVLLAIARLR